ncbi:phosphatase PAP2 family protein [Micromonospora sp. NPDC007271]|uniref:phosphatase PAP2 family protein n=1 Tax=Micromonospora sp. NPDC007271 TaxID=3154587 RepID=UPI0033EA34CE
MRRRLPGRPEEWLFGGFLLLLAVLVVVTGAPVASLAALVTDPTLPLVVLAGAAVGVVVVALRSRPPRLRRGLAVVGGVGRAMLPMAACLVCYAALRDLTPALGLPLADPALSAFDRSVFGVDVSRWLNDTLGSPALTLAMVVCYLSYGSTQAAYALRQHLTGRVWAYRDFSLAVAIVAVLGYTGYLLVPGVGPHVWQVALYADQLPGHGGALGSVLDTITSVQGPARDIFPSLHTGMTVVLMGYLWRDARTLFWCYLPVGLGVLLSTVYLRKHYAVDVLAGILVVVLAMAVAKPVNRRWFTAEASYPDGRSADSRAVTAATKSG